MTSNGVDRQEVAVYVDLENLRYSLLNIFGQEPDFGKLVEKAKKYGRPSVMRAYADFTEHPEFIRQQLHIAGIEAISVNVKRIRRPGERRGVERVKNAADMILALDAIIEAMDADSNRKKKVFLLVTGDADYIRLVTNLKHRFGQRVIVAGVPESIANNLVTAADSSDPIEVQRKPPADKVLVKKALIRMIQGGPAPLRFWSISIIDQWALNPKQAIPGTPREQRDAIHDLLNEGVLVKKDIDLTSIGKKGSATETYLVVEKARELGYLE
ncbi:MAG: NYN domain-containing protein [Chloroflexi bacterium]|nr:NYN domain-containing protein [Chloroflexota bacterium]